MLKTLKSAIKRMPYPLFLLAYYTWYFAFGMRDFRRATRAYRIPRLDSVELGSVRTSETVFILATGSSINRISAERWQAISTCDTMGLNFWLYHPFVPTLYFFEEIDVTEEQPQMLDFFLDICRRRAEEYSDTVKVITDLKVRGRRFGQEMPPAWRANLYALPHLHVPARDEHELAAGLRIVSRLGAFRRSKSFGYVCKHASSLSAMIACAVRMGYKRIVLCGVDLTNQQYFYQDPDLYRDIAGLQFSPPQVPHVTSVPIDWRVPVSGVIRQLRREILDPAGVEIYVENRSSGLWPEVPEMPDDFFGQTAGDVAGQRQSSGART